MIALPHSLPYVRIGGRSLALCQSEWLSQTLDKAASGAGIPRWFAEDISRGVENYLANHYPGSVIDSEELFDRIEKTLSGLGLRDMAEQLDRTPPPVRISLSELARRAGAGYELAFFALLDEQLRSAATGGAPRIEIHGLRPCVKRLSSAKKWTPRCEQLKREITAFIGTRERTAQASREPQVCFAS